jgi:hypothetical protein
MTEPALWNIELVATDTQIEQNTHERPRVDVEDVG